MAELDRFTCEETFRRLDDFIDRELTDAELAQVKTHLEKCTSCAHGFAFEDSVIRELRQKIKQVAIPDDLRERVFRRLNH